MAESERTMPSVARFVSAVLQMHADLPTERNSKYLVPCTGRVGQGRGGAPLRFHAASLSELSTLVPVSAALDNWPEPFCQTRLGSLKIQHGVQDAKQGQERYASLSVCLC